MQRDLTEGSIVKNLTLFAMPMMLTNILQQCYNIADTAIVGRSISDSALAAVGSAYSLMTFIASILLGLSLGSSALSATYFGKKDYVNLKRTVASSFVLIFAIAFVLLSLCLFFIDEIIALLNTPLDLSPLLKEYLFWIFLGLFGVFLTNYFSCLLRSVGDSVTPLIFLAISAVMNIALDLYMIISLDWGIAGAAIATSISQCFAGLGLMIVTYFRDRNLIPSRDDFKYVFKNAKSVLSYSFLTMSQQSVMNFGILMIQGLVNSFGVSVMAAFAVAVKIDSFAYVPSQDFGSAYSYFISQNSGKGLRDRVRKGTRIAVSMTVVFSIFISILVNLFSSELISLFFSNPSEEILSIGKGYLRIEGSFYALIAILFLLYGYFRADGKPAVSLVLTIVSLGLRVLISYSLAPLFGYETIWCSIVIGWLFADIVGFVLYKKRNRINIA